MAENKILTQIIEQSGLPTELITSELAELITSHGIKPEDITLEDFRKILTSYLQDVFVEAKDHFAS